MFNHAKKYKRGSYNKRAAKRLSVIKSNLVQYLRFDRGRGSIDNWNFGRQNLLAGGVPCWLLTKGFHVTNIGTIPSLTTSAGNPWSRAVPFIKTR